MKVCFTKSVVHVKRMVDFGIGGEREIGIDLAYNKFPSNIKFEVNAVKPIFNSDVLIAIEFDVSETPVEDVTKGLHQKSYRAALGDHYATKQFEEKLRMVGEVQSPKLHKAYTILQSSNGLYYVRSQFGSQHVVRRSMNEQVFQTILSWFRKQLLPATYSDLELKIRVDKIAKSSYFWDFMIIAICRGIIKATVKNHETILYF